MIKNFTIYEIDNIFSRFINKNNSSINMSLYTKSIFKKLIDDYCSWLINKFNLKKSNILGINRIKNIVNQFVKNANLKYPVESNSRRFCCIE